MAQSYKHSAFSKEKVLYRERILTWFKKQFPETNGVLPEGSKYVSLTHIFIKNGKVIPHSEVGIGLGMGDMKPLFTPKQVYSVDNKIYVTVSNRVGEGTKLGFRNKTQDILSAVKYCVKNKIVIGALHLDLMTLPENENTLSMLSDIFRTLSLQNEKVAVVINLQMRSRGQKLERVMQLLKMDIRERLRENKELKEVLRTIRGNNFKWEGWQKEIYHPYNSLTSRFPYQAMLLVKEAKEGSRKHPKQEKVKETPKVKKMVKSIKDSPAYKNLLPSQRSYFLRMYGMLTPGKKAWFTRNAQNKNWTPASKSYMK
jgi:hypothetical protein